MIEAVIMLLPVAAASGWYVASRHYKKKASAPLNEHTGYFKGLNYLLNEQPDKAIDVFVDLLELDDETIEIHLALGTLFRQRGEVEKSIRLHQNLIARPQLTNDVRLHVLSELGMDYMRAGLLDRAESIFIELESTTPHKTKAIKQLLLIYQQESDWLKAVQYAMKLQSIDKTNRHVLLSHLHCEIAGLSIESGDMVAAKKYLNMALKIDPLCVRATVMTAERFIKSDDYKQALKSLMKLSNQDIRFVPVYLELIVSCFDALDKPKQKFNFLAELQAINQSAIVYSHFVDVLVEQKGEKHALVFMREKLRDTPKASYLKIYADIDSSVDSSADDLFLKETINNLSKVPISFQCNQCGFKSIEVNWCCPSCKEWGVSEPVLT